MHVVLKQPLNGIAQCSKIQIKVKKKIREINFHQNDSANKLPFDETTLHIFSNEAALKGQRSEFFSQKLFILASCQYRPGHSLEGK